MSKSSNKRDIVEGAVIAAATIEIIEAIKMLVCMWADPEAMPEVKAKLNENQQILMTNFTK